MNNIILFTLHETKIMDSNLRKLTEQKYIQYKKKTYLELKKIIDKGGDYFSITYNKKKYHVEIDAEFYKEKNIRVRIECEKNNLLSFFGIGGTIKFFGKTPDGKLIKTGDEIIF